MAMSQENLEGINPVSDEKYAEELQIQEVLMGSKNSTQMRKSACLSSLLTAQACLEPKEESMEVKIKAEDGESSLSFCEICCNSTQMRKSASLSSLLTAQACLEPKEESMEVKIKAEDGESSLSFCEICCERKENDQMFNIESCVHSFCYDCISKHVATKVQDSITTVTCPGLDCKSILEFDACKQVLPMELLVLWEEALCEKLIDVSQKFYCPFKDCSAMMVYENGEGEFVITQSECPFCHRLFCAQCYVPWHPAVDCEEYQILNVDEKGREDLMVRELAKEKQWSRCPHCRFFVERTEGCPHMTCRCQFQFCYKCRAEWTSCHGGCP